MVLVIDSFPSPKYGFSRQIEITSQGLNKAELNRNLERLVPLSTEDKTWPCVTRACLLEL